MANEQNAGNTAQNWFDASRRMAEEYVSSSSKLSARYFEACRKYAAPATRRQAVDDLLQTAVDAVSLLPRLAVQHLKPQGRPGQNTPDTQQGVRLTTNAKTPVSAEIIIDNTTATARSVTLTASPFIEQPNGPEIPSDTVTLSPSAFDLAPNQSQTVTMTINPTPLFKVGKEYLFAIICSGGLEGKVEMVVRVEEG